MNSSNNNEKQNTIGIEDLLSDEFFSMIEDVIAHYYKYKTYNWNIYIDTTEHILLPSLIHPQLADIESKMIELRDLFQYGNKAKTNKLSIHVYNSRKIPTDEITWNTYRGQSVSIKFLLATNIIKETPSEITDISLLVNFIFVLKSGVKNYIESFYRGNVRLQTLINRLDLNCFKQIIDLVCNACHSSRKIELNFLSQINKKSALEYALKKASQVYQYNIINTLIARLPKDHDDNANTNIGLDRLTLLNNAAVAENVYAYQPAHFVPCTNLSQLPEITLQSTEQSDSFPRADEHATNKTSKQRRKRSHVIDPSPVKRSCRTIDSYPEIAQKLQNVINNSFTLQQITFSNPYNYSQFFSTPDVEQANQTNDLTENPTPITPQQESVINDPQQVPPPDFEEDLNPLAMEQFIQSLNQHPDFCNAGQQKNKK